jgi:hypothetical protein
MIAGTGDVVEPEQDLIVIGSGGTYAQSAARALLENTDLDARTIVEKALAIAADICIYTNHNRTIEVLRDRFAVTVAGPARNRPRAGQIHRWPGRGETCRRSALRTVGGVCNSMNQAA